MVNIIDRISQEILHARRDNFCEFENIISLSETMKSVSHGIGSINRYWIPKSKEYYGLPHTRCTDADIVRQYLLEKLDVVGKKKISVVNSRYIEYWFPMYVPKTLPLYKNHALYIDIKSCFYAIYSMFGIDCACDISVYDSEIDLKYFAGGIMDGSLLNDIKPHKKHRNMIYGLTRGGNVLRSKYGKQEYVEIPSPLKNNSFHNLVFFILHSIFSKIKRLCYYWNIDGGFFHEDSLEYIIDVVHYWGLSFEYFYVENLEVHGLSMYKSDIKSTARLGKGSPLSNVFTTKQCDEERIRKYLEL